MSVEGLLSEVSGILASRLTIKAADQAFFGNKQVYTNVSLASTSGNKGQAHRNEKKDKKQKGGHASDELGAAIKKAESIIDKALAGQAVPSVGGNDPKVHAEIAALKKENQEIKKEVADLRKLIEQLTLKCNQSGGSASAATPKAAVKEESAEKDDDFDLFGSEDEEEDEEKKKIVEERLKAYNEKKSKKPGPIAKSSVILDVKPWDDETNLEDMEKLVRGIELDGLVWGGAKLIPIGYGIKKLQIICVIEDLKVSVDDLVERITGDFEDHVQSVDIAAFNKI